MQELFDKSFVEVFNVKYVNDDCVDRTEFHRILTVKGIKDFYFTVNLKCIEKYLTEIVKKD